MKELEQDLNDIDILRCFIENPDFSDMLLHNLYALLNEHLFCMGDTSENNEAFHITVALIESLIRILPVAVTMTNPNEQD